MKKNPITISLKPNAFKKLQDASVAMGVTMASIVEVAVADITGTEQTLVARRSYR